MTDLTLNEFRGLSDKELAHTLEIEGQNILGSVVLERNHEEKDIAIYCFPFFARCWFRVTNRMKYIWKWPIRRCLFDRNEIF